MTSGIMKTDSPIPVIYVLSNGRSGSTLLDLALNTGVGVWTLGEAQLLPLSVRSGQDGLAQCGCGSLMAECGFWGPILDRIPMGPGPFPIEYFRRENRNGKVLRRELLADVLKGRASTRWRSAVEDYGERNAKFFSVVKEAAEREKGQSMRWLVDASKDPYRLLWMKESGRFALRIIHIVKDPRAYVFSTTRRGRDGWRSVIRMAGRWLVQNYMSSRLCRRSFAPTDTFFLRYEDLANDADGSLARLGDWLDVSFESDVSAKFRSAENHAVAGNPMRWDDRPIRLDQVWRKQLSRSRARFVWCVTWPWRLHYGYTGNGRSPGSEDLPTTGQN